MTEVCERRNIYTEKVLKSCFRDPVEEKCLNDVEFRNSFSWLF